MVVCEGVVLLLLCVGKKERKHGRTWDIIILICQGGVLGEKGENNISQQYTPALLLHSKILYLL